MSDASTYPVLPRPTGPVIVMSMAPMDSLWMYCPGNVQPKGSAHPNPTYLPLVRCKPKVQMHEDKRLYMYRCDACRTHGFCGGPFWREAFVTRAQIVAVHGSGRACCGKTGAFL